MSGNLRHVNEAAEKQLEINAHLLGVPVSIPGAQYVRLTAQIIARLQKVLTKGEAVE